MSYDLNFWRYRPGIRLKHQRVYEQLSDGQRVDELEDLPIDQIMRRIDKAFATWKRIDAGIFDGGEKGGFEVYTTAQHFRAVCRGMDGDDLSRLIDIGAEFGCPLYDPQEGKRYDLK